MECSVEVGVRMGILPVLLMNEAASLRSSGFTCEEGEEGEREGEGGREGGREGGKKGRGKGMEGGKRGKDAD